MKKVLLIALASITVIAVSLFVFREPLLEMAADSLTEDMFVTSHEAGFDPGIAEGERFPEIAARYQDETITDVSRFAGPNGLVFFANRSADW